MSKSKIDVHCIILRKVVRSDANIFPARYMGYVNDQKNCVKRKKFKWNKN